MGADTKVQANGSTEGLLRPRHRTRTYPFRFILFTKASQMANSRVRFRNVEIDSALDPTLLERGVMKSHDKRHGYKMGKELGQMMQAIIMN